MPPEYLPLRWEITGDQWWFASPIDWAAANGHYDLVRELLHLDTNLLIKLTSLRRIRRLETVWDDDVDDQEGKKFNDVAKCRSQVAQKLLLECEESRNGHHHNSLIRAGYGGWLLYTAASAGDVGFVKQLLERNPLLIYGEGEYGVTDILYAAARSKNSEVFRLLLDASLRKCGGSNGGVEPEEVSSVYKWEIMNRAVHAAARGGYVEMLRELLGDCEDVLVYRDSQGSTLLHSASVRGQIEVVRSLLASYELINSTDNEGNTALHVAAYRGHLAVVDFLISTSPSIRLQKNKNGDTFLHMAVASFRSPGFRRLDRQMALMKQLASCKTANIEDIINEQNKDGRTALHIAVTDNIHSELVELLMSIFGINLNVRDNDGRTALDLLKQHPKSASSEILIKRLIQAGGIGNSRDHLTRSALVSHLKMHGIGGSPGTSFRIPDSEIFLYAGIENADAPSPDVESCITDYDMRSGELTGSVSNKTRFGSVNSAARRLKLMLHLPKTRARTMAKGVNLEEETNSVDSYKISSPMTGQKPIISLRQRFSKSSNRIAALSNNSDFLPSPSTKKKFAAGLMHGVLQVKRQHSLSFVSSASPSSPLSESSWSLPMSAELVRAGNKHDNHSPRHQMDDKMRKIKRSQSSFSMKAMNRYLCFGAQGLNADDHDGRINLELESQACNKSTSSVH
ncbi:OLC1v1028734C1 [Oldenlandia corymbosa var. corymbosa]|uniref:OLC1v1028734C1 n=1 Tax=Oldenlandia corymbosa var. corymbosa TaxID=529605 RepID=A0AAV1CCD8_OLDCO|nr:OLC1v1028734C1 [Oldenlandia corymbosa var. corymbosa]